ncbi:hypothetical protein J7I44_13955 [Frateuria sp. MAH-13]|uniref:Core-binding (CB) domain-containing protein n=1 Tax=Frateuria flava TaxID=2821489 RepID=A0ABS4DQT4_9GAMM|nr:hypothetical protein [Frateuria flava]MBP1475413.1 hypothetical protein [Frateuria flava]
MSADVLPPSPRSVEDYLDAAQRENTLRSYASAVRHFEETWGGLLPANAAQIARYLAAYAGALSINTLKHRLAALAQWHKDHGFADPTQATLVKQTLKGIQAVHPGQEKRATPLQLTELGRVCHWLDEALEAAEERADAAEVLRLRRDKAMLLLGFWRGFRTDELVRLKVEPAPAEPVRAPYARIVHAWVRSIGLDPYSYGTHSMRRTKVALIYRQTKNLRAVQLLLGHTKLESTIRYLGVEVDDALELAEQTEA